MKMLTIILTLVAAPLAAAQFAPSGTLALYKTSEYCMRPLFEFALTLDGTERFASHDTYLKGETTRLFDQSGHWVRTHGPVGMIEGVRNQGTEWRAWPHPQKAGAQQSLPKCAPGKAELIRCLVREAV